MIRACMLLTCLAAALAWSARARAEVPATETLEALWKALMEHYPVPEYVGVQGDSWLREFRPRVAAAPNRQAAFEAMGELVCRFNDYHTFLRWKGAPAWNGLAARTEPALRSATATVTGHATELRPFAAPPELGTLAPHVVAVVSAPSFSNLRAGDVILSVDGVPVETAMKRAWLHARGSSRLAKLREASWRIFMGPPAQAARLQIRRGRRALQVTSPRKGWPDRPALSSEVRQGVPVIRITSFDSSGGVVAGVDALLEQHRRAPGLVFDVRDNGGGSDDVADQIVGRFVERPVVSSLSFVKQGAGGDFRRMVAWTRPRGPWRFGGRVAVVIDEGCMSACDGFVSGMAEAGALLVGTATGGACGWSKEIELPGDATLTVARTFPLHTGGLPSPLIGTRAREQVPRVLGDLAAGRDRAVDTAVRRALGH